MRFLVARVVHGLGVVLGVSVLVFALTWLRGDPLSVLVPLNTPPTELDRLRHDLGLDQPLPVQYVAFVTRAVRGDFGDSLRQRSPALPLVLERLPATFMLLGAALGFAVLTATPLAVAAAGFRGRGPDLIARTIALVGQSLAAPWVGLMLILLFAVRLRWLPSSGLADPSGILLPGVVVGLYPAAGLVRLLRAGLIDVLSSDYIRAARGRGLPERLIIWRHALRNAALPALTFLGLQVTFLFGNSVVAEAVFAYPGVGRLAVEAVGGRDLPLIQAFVCVVAVLVVLANIVVDALYAWLDPRIRLT
jgi:peptide/nickel transport system permease protein